MKGESMMQQLNVQLAIAIPADQVLISKVELEELQSQSLTGVFWTMKDLEQRTSRKKEWLVENLLYQPRFKKQLEHIVYYPKGKGSPWSFNAPKMAKFLEDNFHLIYGI